MPTYLLALSPGQHHLLGQLLQQDRQRRLELLELEDPRQGLAELDKLNIQRIDQILYTLAGPPLPSELRLREEEIAALRRFSTMLLDTEEQREADAAITHLCTWLLGRLQAHRFEAMDPEAPAAPDVSPPAGRPRGP